MGSDAIANARLSAFAKDSAKKKKGSNLAKVRQDKLDVRRQQWLSQVKSKKYKMETNNCGASLPSSIPKGTKARKTQENLPRRPRKDEHHEILATFDDNEAVTWMSSSIGTKVGRNGLCKDFSESGSCSSSSSEGGERDEGCLDDWEAVADALAADGEQQSESGSFVCHDDPMSNNKLKMEAAGMARGHQGNSRAWTPDDAFRPRTLPSLTKKQHSITQNSEPCISQGRAIFSWKRVVLQQPSSCPICCEDLDLTDSSFLPCPCGFRLCLFCHKRILEVDGRCPGCRKQYDSVSSGVGFDHKTVALQMAHSCNKNTRF